MESNLALDITVNLELWWVLLVTEFCAFSTNEDCTYWR